VYDQPYAAGTTVNFRRNEVRPRPRTKRSNPIKKLAEAVCWIIAVLALGWFAYVQAEAYFFQGEQSRRLDALLHNRNTSAAVGSALSDAAGPSADEVLPFPAQPAGESSASVPTAPRPRVYNAAPGDLLGRIEIPRLHVSATIIEGDDTDDLRHSVGHIPGTALPWESGNIGLAGHRDSFFRSIGNLRDGDQIVLTTIRGTFQFRAAEFAIVKPDDVGVLSSVQQPALTLVTCYPFHYIGSAPKRFVIRAWRGPTD
jgi:LPXTG-site transpeptidase (sortase) family protein